MLGIATGRDFQVMVEQRYAKQKGRNLGRQFQLANGAPGTQKNTSEQSPVV